MSLSSSVHAAAGSIAGMLTMGMLYPLESVRVRLAVQEAKLVKKEKKEEKPSSSEEQKLACHSPPPPQVASSATSPPLETPRKEKDSHKSSTEEAEDEIQQIQVRRQLSFFPPKPEMPLAFSSTAAGPKTSSSFVLPAPSPAPSVTLSRSPTPLRSHSLSSTVPTTIAESDSSLSSSSAASSSSSSSSATEQIAKQTNEKIFSNAYDCAVHIVKTEGISSLYKGCRSAIFAVGFSNLVYFYWYSLVKRLTLTFLKRSILLPLDSMFVSTVAGTIAAVITTPLWVVNARMTVTKTDAAHPPLSIWGTIKDIVSKDGFFKGFYNGIIPSLILVSNPVINFLIYEQLTRFLAGGRKHLSAIEYFLIGALAKAVATVVTYPYQVLKARMQVCSQKGFWSLIRSMWQDEGWFSFFKGLETKLFFTVLNSAFMFMTYEKILQLTAFVMGQRKSAKS
eukprot:TRINITY_DN1264_c0_g1_i1.p1 TRINITY_DN1264_c0_g1~~TRINITY_DN1264_c0_g1_i1.p1  ORF type:complete len:468 (-),score=142.08 TRINITY_DN1264_c0_g1_i1:238-1587(-)